MQISNIMKKNGIYLALASAGLLAIPYAQAETALSTAKRFCSLHNQHGLEKKYPTVMSASLNTEIQNAMKKNDAVQKKAPDEKPPLGDGIPFQSTSDWAKCRITSVQKSGADMKANILYRYSKTESWTDQLLLKRENDTWKIDDVLYAPKHVRSLRKQLREAFQ